MNGWLNLYTEHWKKCLDHKYLVVNFQGMESSAYKYAFAHSPL